MLLSYTPPLERDLRAPWAQDRPTVDCSDRDGDYSIELFRFHYPDDNRRGPLRPCLVVSTARVENYEDHSFEDHETHLWFHPNRESFRLAYRVARILRKRRCVEIYKEALRHFFAIEPAAHHSIGVIKEAVAYADYLADGHSACTICGGIIRGSLIHPAWANPARAVCNGCLRSLLLLALQPENAL